MKKYPRVCMRTKAALLFLSCFLLWIPSLHGQVSFFTPPAYSVFGPPFALSDFNGDGKPDLIGCNGGCMFQLGNGDGTFGTAQQVPFNAPVSALADFNGDGRLDLLEQGTGTLLVQLGNGDGTFQQQIPTFVNIGGVTNVVASDLRGIGKEDVIGLSGGNLIVILGNGDGTFAQPVSYSAANGSLLTLGDFNGDGKPDVALTTTAADGLSSEFVFLGNGDGTLQSPRISTGVYLPNAVVAGDFNGDGNVDIVVAANPVCNGTCTTPVTSVLFGNGDGTFQAPTTIFVGDPGFLIASDLNHDGNLDLVAVTDTYQLQIYLGNGNGTFFNAHNYDAEGSRFFSAVADVNNDGNPDILVDSVVLLGNGDGSFQGLPAVPVAFEPAYGINGDFDKNGSQDVAVTSGFLDLAILINDGAGNLRLGQTITLPQDATSIATADINRDGNLDLVVTGTGYLGPGSYTILLGNGDGTFQTPASYSLNTGTASKVQIADFNDDGIPDLAVSAVQGDAVAVLLGNGDGTFGSPTFWVEGGGGDLAVADFNNDGNLDIASDGTAGVAILLGKGDGTFQPPSFPSSKYSLCCVGDLNLDGKADLVTSVGQVLLGNGDGTFTPLNTFNGGDKTIVEGLSDINGDGIPDLIAFTYGGSGPSEGSGSILLGDGSGGFGRGFGAPNFFLEELGPDFWLAVDMTGDGKPDLVLSRFDSYYLGLGLGEIFVDKNTTQSIAIASLSPTALNFGSQTVGAGPLLPLPVTLTNTGAIPLNVASVAISGANASEFILTNNCTKIQPLASCVIDVAFSPTIEGAAAAVVTITDNAGTGTQTIPLAGSGVAPFAFTLSTASGSPSTQTINAGQSAAFQMEINPTDTFGGSVALACTVTPLVAPSPEPTCSLPASINVTTGVAAPFTVTVSTTGTTTAGSISRSRSLLLLAWFSLPMGLAVLAFDRKNPGNRSLAGCCVSIILLVLFVGCGGGNSGSSPGTSGTPAGTYTVNVTASSQGGMVNSNLTVVVR